MTETQERLAPQTRAEWHSSPPGEVAAVLGVDPAVGLSDDAAALRLAEFGPNRLEDRKARPRWLLFLDQFRNLLVGLLVVGAIIAALVGDLKDAIAIGAVLLFNASLGYVQERRAEASLDALRGLLALRTRVRRSGRVVEVAAEALVPGDVVLLEAGDRVPADGRVIEAWAAQVDESSLTGESVPVTKDAGAVLAPGCALGDRVTGAYMNSQVTQGRLVMVVVDTAMATEIGRVADLVADGGDEQTPLQRQLDRLGKRLAAISGSIVAVYFVLGLLRGIEPAEVLISAVALIVAAIPEGLPAVVTLTLAIGTTRLARRGAIVRRLASVETLGSTSLICSDKTGTLTLNQMTVRSVVADGRVHHVDGEGYELSGSLVPAAGTEPDADGMVLERMARAASLCNDSHVTHAVDGPPEVVGDPTEAALVVLAAELGADPDAIRSAHVRQAEIPFDPARKLMATFDQDTAAGQTVEHVKGAWEVLSDRCVAIATAHGDAALTPLVRRDLEHQVDELASSGLRVLAIAERTVPATDLPADADTDDASEQLLGLVDELTLLGLVGLLDPPRPQAIDAVATCRRAGISVRMITGDHAGTASAIAEALGIAGATITGADLDSIDDGDLPARLDGVGVVARVSPEHKVRVVRASRALGDVVAMTGDGVNDAPALVAADIGVAMGITGTEVAKDSADMVLVDDDFATITRAVEQGRGIYDNIVKFVRFQVSTNIGALATFIAAQLLGMPTPFNPIQILWINLIMDGPPAMALGVEPTDPSVMQRLPRDPEEQILTRPRMVRVFTTGALMAVGTLGVLAGLTAVSGEAVALTAAFTTFVLFQVGNALNVRSEHGSVFSRATLRNRPMWIALGAVLALQVVAVQVAAVERIFATTELTLSQWALCAAVASSVIWVEEIIKFIRRRTLPAGPPG